MFWSSKADYCDRCQENVYSNYNVLALLLFTLLFSIVLIQRFVKKMSNFLDHFMSASELLQFILLFLHAFQLVHSFMFLCSCLRLREHDDSCVT